MKVLFALSLIIVSACTVLGQARTAERLVDVPFSQLNTGNPPNGSVRHVINGVPGTSPCQGGGSGADAVKLNGVWHCRATSAAEAAGDVDGPSASTDSELPLFSGTTGKLLKRSNSLTGYIKVASGVVSAAVIPASDLPSLIDATKIADGSVSNAEFQFLNNVASSIQTQIDGKQPLDNDLTVIAGLVATTDNFIVSAASAWSSRTPAQVKTTLALNNVDNTSDATKNAATATLTNKTISGSNNTLTNLPASGISGVIPIANLATGTPDGSKFIRDDGTLQAIPGGGDALTANPLSQFAATTSAQLAGVLTNETGSGAVVFATSPTLVTPALGTPSAAVLTNATGLPLTTGVTGTLPVGNGGTGITSVTSNALVKGNGTSAMVVSGVTVDSSNNISTPGTITSGAGGSVAGSLDLGEGTAPSLVANTFSIYAPTDVAVGGLAYVLPGAAATGFLLATDSSGVMTLSHVGSSGTGNVARVTSPTFTTPALGAATATSINGLTITSSTGTLTVANGKTASFSNTLTFTGTDSSSVAFGTGGTVTYTIASGTSALGTSAIASGACATVVTTAATGTATTDTIGWGFNGDPTGVTGYQASANGMLTIIAYPSANNVNFKVCNNTASSVTPGAITLNWRVTR